MNLHFFCKKSQVAECLFDGYNDGYSPYDMEKAEVLKFYKTTTLIDPCSGEEIDKDDMILSLCAYNQVNMGAIQEELDMINHVNLNDLPIHKSGCNKTEAENIEDFAKFMCNNNGSSKQGFAIPVCYLTSTHVASSTRITTTK